MTNKYIRRLMTLYKLGFELPIDIKTYIDNVNSILDNLYLGETTISDRYQLYDKRQIVHFEFRKNTYEKSMYQAWMLKLYKNKFNQYHNLNLYIISQYYNINIIDEEYLKENHTLYEYRLGFFNGKKN